jgi:hypothetical protein
MISLYEIMILRIVDKKVLDPKVGYLMYRHSKRHIYLVYERSGQDFFVNAE